MAATNHDIFSHAERIGRIVDIQRVLDDAKRTATSAQRHFDARMRLADQFVTWEELWDSIYIQLDISRQLCAQAKVQLDNLLGSVTESATFYPGFLFQAKWEVGKGGVAKITITNNTTPTADTIKLYAEDDTLLADPFACAVNTYTDSDTLLDVDDRIVIVGTTNHDGVYTVLSCGNDTITLADGTFTNATESCTTSGAYVMLVRRNLGV